eukprot:TRINITY_DN854_c0_g1_i1.p1 TRINITY_DN854_c0_g1~~TRINITY_DN854_c0_g1_i1.p1  ORF type:complete len:542 (+),score=128.32 TRINITY_DN854_c0_g1_i1:222-1847(+)
MVVLRCKCLNFHVHLSRAPVAISPDSEVHVWISEQTNIKKVGEAELGMGGSKAEYEKLVSFRKVHGWKLTRCCNCNTDLYLISQTNPTLALVNMELDDQSMPIQGSNINTSATTNTSSPNSSPASSSRKFSSPITVNSTATQSNTPTPPSQLFHYSPTFRMFLLKSGNEDTELLIPPNDSDPTSITIFNKLQKQIDDFLAEEERLMDRRIKAFIKEQNEHFKELQGAAYTDRKLLWNRICTVNGGGNTNQTQTQTQTPVSASAITPTPANVPSTPKAKDWTSARVKLQGSAENITSTSISQNRLSADYQNNTSNDLNNNSNNNNNNNNTNDNNNNTQNLNPANTNTDSTTAETKTTSVPTTPQRTSSSFIPKLNGSAKMPNGHSADEPDTMFSFDEEDEETKNEDKQNATPNVEEEKEEVEPPPLSKHRLVGATQQSSSYSGVSSPQLLLGTSVPVAIPSRLSVQRPPREPRRGSRTSQNEEAFDMDFQAALQKGIAKTYVVPRQSWSTTILEPSDLQPDMAQSFKVPLSLNYRRTNRTGE